jgi:hypothetical protein
MESESEFRYRSLRGHLTVGCQIIYLFGNLEFVRYAYNFGRFRQESFKIFQKIVNENTIELHCNKLLPNLNKLTFAIQLTSFPFFCPYPK